MKKTVQLESASNGDSHIIWQPASQLFVPSWKYLGSNGTWYVRARKYHPDGTAAGTAINAFPTYTGSTYQPNQEDDGYVGASGAYLGMAYQSIANNWAYLNDRGQRRVSGRSGRQPVFRRRRQLGGRRRHDARGS